MGDRMTTATPDQIAAVLERIASRSERAASATTPATCIHPAARLYAWWARDDTAPDGRVLCVGCMDCGAVLAGGVTQNEGPEPAPEGKR